MSDPLPQPERKWDYVRDMFGRIAQRYDLMNRVMTMGRDGVWRRHTVEQVLPSVKALEGIGSRAQAGRVLDVATGTGDLALEVLRQVPDARVVGLDFVTQMLSLAQHKASEGGRILPLLCGDALRLPFADETFDGVVTAFALRNVTDIPAAFAEMARITRQGGRVANLEIAKPRSPVFRTLFSLYFYRMVPAIGGLITGERAAYTYLPHSLTAFLTPDEIKDVMEQTGWCRVHYRRLMIGTVAMHVGVRE